MASYLYRTATTAYPCYIPVLGEFSRSWSYKTCHCKGNSLDINLQMKMQIIVEGCVFCLPGKGLETKR